MMTVFAVALAVLILGPVLLSYTLGPFLIWRQQKLQTVFAFESLAWDSFLAKRNAVFQGHARALDELGFARVGASVLRDSHSTSWFGLYWSAEYRLAAMIVSIDSPVQSLSYLEFSQKYSDGSILNVSNNHMLGAYPDTARKITLLCPELQQAEDLLAAQQQIRRGLVSGQYLAVDYPVESGFAEIEKLLQQESDTLVQRGLAHAAIDADGKRALTFWGALIMTYRMLPPWRQLLVWRNRQRARRLLALARISV